MLWPSKFPSARHVILRCKIRRIRRPAPLRPRPATRRRTCPPRLPNPRRARSENAALRRRHLARKPADRLGRALAEQRMPGARMRQRQQLQKLRVVVEHLLEVRHEPALVDRVARKAAAEMIVDPALADVRRASAARGRRTPPPRCASRSPPQARARPRATATRTARIGETSARRASPPFVMSIARAMPFATRSSSASPTTTLPSGRAFSASRAIRASRFLPMRSGSSRNSRDELAQHIGERRAAVARLLRKIRAAPHRLARGRQEHRERPAALLAEQMQRVHVDLVDVGPLLAVDLDVDEQLVHHARRRLVLEALVRHHVAPVAGRVADREQDRLVRCASPRRAPPAPTATSRPDCADAAADTARSRRRGDWCGWCLKTCSERSAG